ncbi:hypothetical protein QYE76_049857 [Lolium multiflorum]|uniref:HAT C-terminal dimerisation domain-containing protein n=1 Tax=Lolium multiflorum TaxID=4521 RepID=A0AAD8SQW8_LOLMU|nr:hypothetical protein QYE76_049857 [Lolium multiflorum]
MAGESPPPLPPIPPSAQSAAPPSLPSTSPTMAKLTPSLEQQIGVEVPTAGDVLGDPQLQVGGEPKMSSEIHGKLPKKIRKKHVEFRLKQYFGVNAGKHIQEVKIAMEVLFTEYTAEFEENMEILSQEGSGEEVALADSSLSDWQAHIKLKVARCRNELQQYIEEGFHPCTPDFNILKWWDVNSERYPILGNMARDVLAVPASTVASESAFSACGRVITDHRSSLAPETVEALMCYGDWIRSRKPTNAGQENRCEEQNVVDHLVSGT